MIIRIHVDTNDHISEPIEVLFMPKWKEGATEFIVAVNHHETRGYQCNIPKPIMDLLGEPEKVKFVVKGKRIEVEAVEKRNS